MYFNFYVILAGRLLFGLYAGLSCVIIPKYMIETVPIHLFDVFGPLFNVFCGCGLLAAYSIGGILPDNDDTEALEKTELWRIIYFYFPLTLFLISVVGFLTILREDSIKNLIITGKHAEARVHLCKVYKHCKMDTNVDAYLNQLQSVNSSGSSGLTIIDALINPKYRKATWINMGYIVFRGLTGIGVINTYSDQIF